MIQCGKQYFNEFLANCYSLQAKHCFINNHIDQLEANLSMITNNTIIP